MKKTDEDGFSIIIVMTLLGVVVILGLIGYRVISNSFINNKNQNKQNATGIGSYESIDPSPDDRTKFTYINKKHDYRYVFHDFRINGAENNQWMEKKSTSADVNEVNFSSNGLNEPLGSDGGSWLKIKTGETTPVSFEGCYPKSEIEKEGWKQLPTRDTVLATLPAKVYRALKAGTPVTVGKSIEFNNKDQFVTVYSLPRKDNGRCYNLIHYTLDANGSGEKVDDPIVAGFSIN